MGRGWKLAASELGGSGMWGHSPWPVLLPSGKGHVALGLWMATRDQDFGGLCDFLATMGNGGGEELASDRGHLPQQGKLAWLGGSILVNPGGPSVDGSPSAHTWLQRATRGSARLG